MFRIRVIISFAAIAALGGCQTAEKTPVVKRISYPTTQKVNRIDDYNGVKVPDPYRWLEDENSPETAKWVEAENKVTFGYLDTIPYRKNIKDRLEKLYNYVRYGPPFRNGSNFFAAYSATGVSAVLAAPVPFFAFSSK